MPTDSLPSTSNSSPQQAENSHITQSFRDQKQIETFVRRHKLLKIIEETALNFIKTYQETKRSEDTLGGILIKLPFYYIDFVSQSVDLLHLVIEEPLQFADAVKYCVYAIVRDLVKQRGAEAGLKSIDIEQVHVLVRFIGLPLQQDLLFEPAYNLYRTGLSLVFGILSAITEPQKAVIQSVWYCTTGCSRNKIKAGSSDAPICNSCSRQMNEFTKLRLTQTYHLLRILPVASVQTPVAHNKVFRAITVRAKDHTYDCELVLGTRYLITGYYDYRSAQEFQAWNILKH